MTTNERARVRAERVARKRGGSLDSSLGDSAATPAATPARSPGTSRGIHRWATRTAGDRFSSEAEQLNAIADSIRAVLRLPPLQRHHMNGRALSLVTFEHAEMIRFNLDPHPWGREELG